MLNFIHWIAIHKKEIKSLRHLSKIELLELVNEYEGGKLKIEENWELKAKWESGLNILLEGIWDGEGYGEVRQEMINIGLG